mmetsp:Transcript_72634/g.158595  ORF Transcript_72634/g.158595 Transcript_72634/m.158595 type:complete len:82 (+) Transcript_72634:1376-1621(+)
MVSIHRASARTLGSETADDRLQGEKIHVLASPSCWEACDTRLYTAKTSQNTCWITPPRHKRTTARRILWTTCVDQTTSLHK